MEDEKEVEIVLDEQKTPEQASNDPEVVVVSDETPPTDAPDPMLALKELEKKLEREKKKAQKLEREREQAERSAHQARQEAGESRKHVMMAALSQTRMDAERLQNEFADAMSINDYAQVAKIQAEISQNTMRMSQFEQELESLKRQEPVQPQSGSQLDQIIKSVSSESARWLKQNREHLNDDRAIRKMFRAHEDAVEDGIKPDSDEYFEYIEKRLGISEDQPESRQSKRQQVESSDDEPTSAAAKPVTRSVSPPPAPVERYGTRPTVVRLSSSEIEMAKMMGMTDKEYAAHKLALQKEGKMSRTLN